MKLKIIVMISIILFCSSCVSKHTQNFDSIDDVEQTIIVKTEDTAE